MTTDNKKSASAYEHERRAVEECQLEVRSLTSVVTSEVPRSE
ncbi:hypothetical protein [Evansella tamaricis]|nr:hypothetical protein [Evansella tamaricis]